MPLLRNTISGLVAMIDIIALCDLSVRYPYEAKSHGTVCNIRPTSITKISVNTISRPPNIMVDLLLSIYNNVLPRTGKIDGKSINWISYCMCVSRVCSRHNIQRTTGRPTVKTVAERAIIRKGGF